MKLVKNDDGVHEVHVNAEVISINTDKLISKGENKTPYQVGTISMVTGNGEVKQTPCTIWGKNTDKTFAEGSNVFCVGSIDTDDDGNTSVYFRVVGHSSEAISLDDLGLDLSAMKEADEIAKAEAIA